MGFSKAGRDGFGVSSHSFRVRDYRQNQKLPKWYRERQQRHQDEAHNFLDEVLDDLRVLEDLKNDYLELRNEMLLEHRKKMETYSKSGMKVIPYSRDKELEIHKLLMVV